MPDRPIFLERRSYRLRRLLDAMRLLPVLALALWMVPLMWPLQDVAGSEVSGISTGTALRYLFWVWFGLIVTTWLLWRKTRDGQGRTDVPRGGDPD